MPTQGSLTSGYGMRWGRLHQGIDLAAPMGTLVQAAAAGVVVFAEWHQGGYGNLIEIHHADGSLTRYAHLNRIWVSQNEAVAQGQAIGEVGSTGYSTGPHLHFEIHQVGQGAVDPTTYLSSYLSSI
jgi:murein DD-endopeptidase MepM/ murein hydrolase activator NlpD